MNTFTTLTTHWQLQCNWRKSKNLARNTQEECIGKTLVLWSCTSSVSFMKNWRIIHHWFLNEGRFSVKCVDSCRKQWDLPVLESTVDAGHRAVIFDRFRGVQESVVGEGTHFLIPWVQKPIIFDCRSRPRNVPVITGSKGTRVIYSAAVMLSSLCLHEDTSSLFKVHYFVWEK